MILNQSQTGRYTNLSKALSFLDYQVGRNYKSLRNREWVRGVKIRVALSDEEIERLKEIVGEYYHEGYKQGRYEAVNELKEKK